MESQTASKNQSDWPQEDLEAVTRCPVCGSGQRQVLYQG